MAQKSHHRLKIQIRGETVYMSPKLLNFYPSSLVARSNKTVMIQSPCRSWRHSATSICQTSYRAIRSCDSSSFSQHGAHCYITNFRPRPRPFILPVIHVHEAMPYERNQACTVCRCCPRARDNASTYKLIY